MITLSNGKDSFTLANGEDSDEMSTLFAKTKMIFRERLIYNAQFLFGIYNP